MSASEPMRGVSEGNGSTATKRGNASKAGVLKSKPSTEPAHRSLPQSLDAEKGVLCSILLSPANVLDLCIENGVQADHFYLPAHATLYELLLDLSKRNRPIDLVTVTQEMQDRGVLDAFGGVGALNDLAFFVPTAANAEYYLEILREKFLLRQLITVCTETAARSYEEQRDPSLLLDEVERRIFELSERRFAKDAVSMREAVMAVVSDMEKLIANRERVTGLATGFRGLDELTSGLHAGEMVVIAARPSVGKTAFALNIAEHVALDLGQPVAIFSLEMSAKQIVQRFLCSRARIDLQKLRTGFIEKAELSKIVNAAAELAGSKVFIDDTAGISILALRAKARRLRNKHRIGLVVVDYLQLVRSESRRASENRQIEVSEVSYGLKALAKELEIPVLVLAQLNRQPDDKGGRPMLSHLRESGSIEQDADVVGMLYRPELYAKDEDDRQAKQGLAELIIAKQRNGPVGDVPLTYLHRFTRFEDRAPEHLTGQESH